MSVPVYKRNLCKVQFIDTARELVVHSLTYCRHFPKSMMFTITKDILDLSKNIYRCVVRANKWYPNSKHNIQVREKYFREALGDLSTLDCFIGIAIDTDSIKLTDYGWVQWGKLIEYETNLIKRVLQSDASRSLTQATRY